MCPLDVTMPQAGCCVDGGLEFGAGPILSFFFVVEESLHAHRCQSYHPYHCSSSDSHPSPAIPPVPLG